MKNKLSDINNYLFEQIEKLNDDSLSDEETKLVIQKATTINTIAETIVKNGELQFKALKMASDYGIVNQNQVKLLLGAAKDNNEI